MAGRGLVVVAVVAALAGALPGMASAAPPKKTATPVVSVAPATWTNATTASFTFTDATAGAVFSCQVDGSAWKTCASPFSVTGAKSGAHTFAVRASAAGYKTSGSVSRSWNVDLVAPDVPAVTGPTSPTSVTTVVVPFSSTATDVVGYECSVDGGAWAACASPKSVTAGPDGVHTLAVRAVDHATNRSGSSSVQWLQDSSTPKPVVNAMPPDVTSSTSATFGFSSGEQGVSFACSRDGAAFTSCTSGLGYTSLTNGTHTFAVKATDAVGNTATSDLFSWKVSPSATVVLGWSNPATLPAAQTNLTTASFGYTATGQTTLSCRLDGVDLAGCTSPVAASGLTDGTHTFDVVADPGSGTQVVLRASWTVDTVAPPAPVVTGPSGPVASTSANLTVTASEGGDVVTCVLDGGASGCGPALALTGLAQGAHSFTATASDAAGNTAPAGTAWTVDTVAPAAAVTVPVQVESPATVAFNEPVTTAGAGGIVLRTSVGAAVSAAVTCRDGSSVAVSCAGTAVRSVMLQPARPLVPGEYYQVLVNPAGTTRVTDLAGNAAGPGVRAFRAALSLQETSKAPTLSWHRVVVAAAKGGSYVAEHRAGAGATFAFTGTSVTWLTETGRPFGLATVYVDGVRRLSVNNYSSVTRYGVARTVSGLAAGAHKVTILVAGRKGSTLGTDTQVSVDGLRVGTALYVTPALVTTWHRAPAAKAFGGGYASADMAGQAAVLVFRGTGITWYSLGTRATGFVSVYVDGRLRTTVDTYRATTTFRVGRSITGLTNARHTLTLVVAGRHRKGGLGNTVAVDCWVVR